MTSLQARIIQFAARIRGTVEFYDPNSAAVHAAASAVGASRKINRAGFSKLFRDLRRQTPKPPEALVRSHVSVMDHAGKIHTGPTHALIGAELAQAQGGTEKAWQRIGKAWPTFKKGFTTTRQPFVSRGEAKALGKKEGLRIKPAAWRKSAAKGLHSSDLQ